MIYKYTLVHINDIAGIYYSCGQVTDKIVVYGIGAPVVPDSGKLPDAPIILDKKIDLFVPDYIGYGRSDGTFTPMNCINTFLKLHEYLLDGCIGVNYYDRKKYRLRYKTVLHVGKSLGGAYVPLLPRYNPNIDKLGLICPAVDQKAQGSMPHEETNQVFLDSMQNDGYKYLYRGIMDDVWKIHLENEDGLSPMDNIAYLKNANVFIGHGKKDQCIHYSKSVNYHSRLIKYYPDRQDRFKLKLYANGDHGPSTSNNAIKDFLDWVEV